MSKRETKIRSWFSVGVRDNIYVGIIIAIQSTSRNERETGIKDPTKQRGVSMKEQNCIVCVCVCVCRQEEMPFWAGNVQTIRMRERERFWLAQTTHTHTTP